MVNIKKCFKSSLISLILMICLLNFITLNASGKNVYDKAELFSQYEVGELESMIKDITDVYEVDVLIATVDNTNDKTSQQYADDFYDDNNLGQGSEKSGILLLIDMDNREIHLSTAGKAIEYFTDQRQANIIDNMFENGLETEDYFQASSVYILMSKEYLNKGIPTSTKAEAVSKPQKSLGLFDGIISLASGAIASAFFFFKTKSNYAMKDPVKQSNYKVNSNVKLSQKQDILIDTVTTNRIIPKTNKADTDLKTSTHKSASNKTHGGSGRKL